MRTKAKIDRTELEAAIKKAEAKGPLKNLSALWKEAAIHYNKTAETPISFSVVMLRAAEWHIETQTQPGRKVTPKVSNELTSNSAGEELTAEPAVAAERKSNVGTVTGGEEIDEPVAEIITHRISIERSRNRYKFDDIVKCLMPLSDPTPEGETLTFQNVYVGGHGNLELEGFKFDAVYAQVKLDRKEDTIEVWVLDRNRTPDYRITNVFVKD
jgi:hypothetical protein